MNSQKTYASAVKGVKQESQSKQERPIKQESQSKQESPIKQEIPKPYCECCRKIVEAVAFKEWCNMFMCNKCENWIWAHGC